MKNIFLYLISAFIFFLGACNEQTRHQLPSLSETFRKDDKKPFGGFVAFNGIRGLFENRFIQSMEDPFDVSWKNLSDFSSSTNRSLYVLITRNLITTNQEADAMVDFVTNGSDLFVAADYISANFLKKIACNTERAKEVISEVAGSMKVTFVKSSPYKPEKVEYKYYYFPFYNSFSWYDTASVKVLGLNELGNPNYIVLFIGKGSYFLLVKNNY